MPRRASSLTLYSSGRKKTVHLDLCQSKEHLVSIRIRLAGTRVSITKQGDISIQHSLVQREEILGLVNRDIITDQMVRVGLRRCGPKGSCQYFEDMHKGSLVCI
jgi:hypothetical protein